MRLADDHKIGVFEATAYCLGDIVGSGIFVSPTCILRHSGSIGLSLLVWLFGAFIAVCGALVYVELGTCIKKSGCDFAYLSHASWHPLAVAFLWVSVTLTYPTILAIQTLAFGEYMVRGISRLIFVDPFWEGTLKRFVGFTALWLLVFMNLFSLKNFAGRFQVIVTASKLFVISLIICTGFYFVVFKGHYENFQGSFFEGSNTDLGNFALGLYASLFAYNGWDILNFGTEEIDNPRRTLPIASMGGIFLAAVVYIAVNVAYFSVMTVDEFLASETVAAEFAVKTLGSLSYFVPFMIALLLLGNLNSTIFGCSRYLFAGAKRNVVPTMFSSVHEASMSPRAAVLMELIVAVIISFIADLEHLIGYMSFAMWLQRAFTQVALLYMRYQGYHFPKDAFITPIYLPILFLIISIMLLVVPAQTDPQIPLYACIIVSMGLIIYFLFIRPEKKPLIYQKINEKMVILTQIVLNTTLLEDDGSI